MMRTFVNLGGYEFTKDSQSDDDINESTIDIENVRALRLHQVLRKHVDYYNSMPNNLLNNNVTIKMSSELL